MKSVSKLHKDLWKVFSEYIRLRDSKDGYAPCFTCDRVYEIKKIQAGHFISRRYKSILYDERNVHAQCFSCNIGKNGNTDEYFIRMERRYGREVVDELMQKKHETKHFMPVELMEMIQDYKERISILC